MKKKVMLKEKLLRVSIILIVLFTATIFFVTNNRVNNLVEKSISTKLNCISNLGMDIIENKYYGGWNVKDGKLFKGETPVNSNFEVIAAIKEKTGSLSSIYLGDEVAATNVPERAVGSKVSNEVAESVLSQGATYEGTENILGGQYAVKYLPLINNEDQIIGIWSVGMPKNFVATQGSSISAMRTSIIVISMLCGILGCVVLMLYSKKYLNDIDTHKVLFLESDSNSNNAQLKVLKMSLLLISTFLVIWVSIQAFTIGNVVNKLEDNNIKDRLNTSSELGYMLIDELYKGDWSIQNNKLYKGINSLYNNSMIVDRINLNTESLSTIYMDDTSISTNIKDDEGSRPIGFKASNDVATVVLRQGKEYTGEAMVANLRCISKFTPLKDSSGKVIGMWNIGIEKKLAVNQVAALRKAITQISILAIIIAFATFIFLSKKMVSDVNNFNISLHTKAS